jgi:alkylation response protein AidB-like acyl-CoA dehydrogenase
MQHLYSIAAKESEGLMDFALTPAQQQKQKEFRAFTEELIAPIANKIEQQGRVPLDLLRKAAKRGYLAPIVPQVYGGAGYDLLTFTLLVEEIAKHSLSIAIPFAIHTCLATGSILEAGNDEQKNQFLPRLTQRSEIAAFALTEAEAGSDAGALTTTAQPTADGYLLNGVKTWVSNGGIANVFVVFAKITSHDEKHGSITGFIVDRKKSSGLNLIARENTLGLRGADIRTLKLENTFVPHAHQLGETGKGWGIIMRAFNRVRVVLASAALGTAEHTFELGLQYAAQRHAFNSTLAHKQRIQNYIAECAVEIESLRQVTHYATWLADTGQDYSVPANIAKFLGGRVAGDVADKVLQIYGGAGYREDEPIARIYRDVRALRLLGGTDEIQQFSIARDAFRQIGVKIEP